MQRCPVQSGEQLTELLERFVTVASLGKSSAAEEVGKGALWSELAPFDAVARGHNMAATVQAATMLPKHCVYSM